MAKKFFGGRDDDDPKPADPKQMEVPAGEARPAEAGESAGVEGGEAKGTPVYPPPASDRSGERTANVPPSKQLPTRAPGSESPDPTARLTAENAAFRTALSGVGLNPDKIAEDACRDLKSAAAAPAGPTATAVVTAPGFGPTEVEYPADTPADRRDAAAVEAFKRKHGVWSLGEQPTVEHKG